MKVFVFIVLMLIQLNAQRSVVYVAKIDGEIDLGLAPFVERVIKEANEAGAEAILFEINTFGGRVDAATQIKDAIMSSNLLTIAFVNKRAVSAGALITLSCKKIAMATGSVMGASTVVDQTGQKVGEKYQSYMRSEMRSTAEKNGRRADIAEAMVDETVVVEGLDDSTKLVTLTATEALSYAMCDTILDSKEAVVKAFGFENPKFVYVASNWGEDFVRFLNNPIISSLLIMIGLVGMFTEIKTPGWGFAGTAALIALALFFGSSLILDLASMTEILIFAVGVVLLLLEIFVIPGFGFVGIAGIALILGSIFFALFNIGPVFEFSLIRGAIIQMAIILVMTLLIIVMIFRFLPKSTQLHKFVLENESGSKEGFVSNTDFSHLLNATGTTITPLRPSGIVQIDGKKYDVVTEGGYFESNVQVKVIAVDGLKIVVDKV